MLSSVSEATSILISIDERPTQDTWPRSSMSWIMRSGRRIVIWSTQAVTSSSGRVAGLRSSQ